MNTVLWIGAIWLAIDVLLVVALNLAKHHGPHKEDN